MSDYGRGNCCNGEPRQFPRYVGPEGQIRLHQQDGQLFLDLPAATEATEATVLQRPWPWSSLLLPNGPRASHSDGHEPTMANVARPDPTGTSDGHRGQLFRVPTP